MYGLAKQGLSGNMLTACKYFRGVNTKKWGEGGFGGFKEKTQIHKTS